MMKMSCICCFLFLMLATYSDCFEFTKQPPRTVRVMKGENVWLEWKYKLDPGKTLVQGQCRFQPILEAKPYYIANGRPKNFRPRLNYVKVATMLNIYKIGILNVDYNQTGIYTFHIFWMYPLSENTSHRTYLTIEGKPIFCDGFRTNQFQRIESETGYIPVTVCAHPKPTLAYHWDDEPPSHAPVFAHKQSTYRYSGKVRLPSIHRNRCGRYVTVYGTNRYGESVKQKVKVNVAFTPKKAENVTARYLQNGTGVIVKWNKQESGLCHVDYRVDFLNSSNSIVHSKSGKNMHSAHVPNWISNRITHVNISASTSWGEAVSSHHKVSDLPFARVAET